MNVSLTQPCVLITRRSVVFCQKLQTRLGGRVEGEAPYLSKRAVHFCCTFTFWKSGEDGLDETLKKCKRTF